MKGVKGMDAAVVFWIVCVGLPVAGGLAYAAYESYLKHKREIAALQGASSKSEVEQLRERVRELERRVEALESVVTSSEFQLFRERMKQIQSEAMKSLPSTGQPQTFLPQREKQTER